MKNKHGANIFEISRDYGFDIEDIVDFSSNINPLGPSETAKQYLIDHMELISSYSWYWLYKFKKRNSRLYKLRHGWPFII